MCHAKQQKGHVCQGANLAAKLTACYTPSSPVALLHEAVESATYMVLLSGVLNFII